MGKDPHFYRLSPAEGTCRGLWPALWTLGNLGKQGSIVIINWASTNGTSTGRAGYGATLEGLVGLAPRTRRDYTDDGIVAV